MKGVEVLVVDDEAQIQKLLKITLQANGFEVRAELTGKAGQHAARNFNPDIILLDLGLPDVSGQEVLVSLRKWYTKPIIILSVQDAEEQIVTALNNGANDYLVKPFRTGELVARINRALRPLLSTGMGRYVSDNLEIDLHIRVVFLSGENLKLTTTEFKLLALLCRNEGKVLTHQYLLKEVWGPGYLEQTQYLRVFIAQLRKKIEPDPNRPRRIVTESGVGYRFIPFEKD